MEDTPGRFWCSECQAFYPDSIELAHEARHASDAKPEPVVSNSDIVFWMGCIAAGAIAGLISVAYR